MIGKTISHCQILEKLGEGRMGVGYKTGGSHLDRFVAIKILRLNESLTTGHCLYD